MVTLAGLSFVLATAFCGCGSGGGSNVTIPPETSAALPTITAAAAQNGAVLVTLSDSTSGAAIHYTTDGTSPLTTFQVYQAPFLVASNLTVNAVATATGYTVSNLATQTFAPNIPSGTLVWSDEFTNTTGANLQPNPAVWGYDTGNGTSGWGNNELEDYCAWNSSASPCDPANPNVYVGTDSALHILARAPAAGSYTSGRVKSQGLFSYQYGRLEAKIWLPEGQGIWPAFWLLGNNISTVNWPACGEMDIAERVNAAGSSPAGNGAMLPPGSPDWNEGSIHGTGFTGGTGLGTIYNFPAPQTAAGWHTYGMVWSKNTVAYYIDDPSAPYVTYTNPASLTGLSGAVWPFDAGQSNFIIMNIAVGGSWPGNPDSTTTFPAEMKVDYVRLYSN
jgi:beta-glucanase (GH16 family)